MKPIKKPARRKAEPGRTRVASQAEASKQQRDVLHLLKESKANGFAIESLKQCSPNRCARDRCREVCAFGVARNHRKSQRAANTLLKDSVGPLFEVRISRASWGRNIGAIEKVSLNAVKMLLRRALDRLYDTDIIAVGSIKVSVQPMPSNDTWRIEIHQIVAGVTRDDLYKVFSPRSSNVEDFIFIDPIPTLDDSLTRVFQHDLQVWQHPTDPRTPQHPKKAARAEYYSWLLPMTAGALTIRYGCDRHFNKLAKEPRTMKPKVARRPRSFPGPEELRYGERVRMERDLENELHPKPPHKPAAVPADYYELDD